MCALHIILHRKQTIEPYFRKLNLSLKQIEARHLQQFYAEKLKTVSANSVIHYHAVIHQALKYAMKTDLVPQNVAMKLRALALQHKYIIPKCYLIDWLSSDEHNATLRKSHRHIDRLWELQKWSDGQ